MTDFKAPQDTALIVVDMQNDFCPGGALAVDKGDRIIPVINAIKPSFEMCIFTQDWHPENHKSFAKSHEGKEPFETIILPYGEQVLWPAHCVQETKGAAFHDDLHVEKNDFILRKGTNMNVDSYSGFFENDHKTQPRFFNGKTLTETLKNRGITRIFICGLAYDFCVGWHALDARKQGFEAIIIKDATRAIAMPVEGQDTTSEKAMDKQLAEAGVKTTNAANM